MQVLNHHDYTRNIKLRIIRSQQPHFPYNLIHINALDVLQNIEIEVFSVKLPIEVPDKKMAYLQRNFLLLFNMMGKIQILYLFLVNALNDKRFERFVILLKGLLNNKVDGAELSVCYLFNVD